MATPSSVLPLTSPLSFISTPESFHTAPATNIEGSTAASSPVQHAPSPYRPARQLPRELKEQCQIYLEEQIYASAITLLDTLLFAGNSRRLGIPRPAFVPPASQIAMIATLAVHPIHTTRAEGAESLEVSAQALGYLRSLLAIVGPVNARMRKAFGFLGESGSRRKTAGGSGRWEGIGPRGGDLGLTDDEEEMPDRDDDHDRLRGPLANESSVWARSDDIWSVVGWAFNCATRFPHRWRFWKIWLEFILDAAEADWDERLRLDDEVAGRARSPGDIPQALRDSLVSSYVDVNAGRRGVQRVVKALLADGKRQSMALFPEVFTYEDRGLKKRDLKRKRDKLDLDSGQFGDYYDEESLASGGSEPPTPPGIDVNRPLSATEKESIRLRLRFFKLVSRAFWHLEDDASISDLYKIFAESINALPLQAYSLFVTTHNNPLEAGSQATILNFLISMLLPTPTASRDPANVDPDCGAGNGISVTILERCYLPYAASTASVDENARVSILLENMLFILFANGELVECSHAFKTALEQGVEMRQSKVGSRTPGPKRKTPRNTTKNLDEAARIVLEDSTERMSALVDLLAGGGSIESASLPPGKFQQAGQE